MKNPHLVATCKDLGKNQSCKGSASWTWISQEKGAPSWLHRQRLCHWTRPHPDTLGTSPDVTAGHDSLGTQDIQTPMEKTSLGLSPSVRLKPPKL